MLSVVNPEQAFEIIRSSFPHKSVPESILLENALGRVLFSDILADEFVPDFDRSTVDGYAVKGADTFGCSDSIPAILELQGDIAMGSPAPGPLNPGSCMSIPTGGALPDGSDAVVMLEYTEDFGDGTIGISKPAPPGSNLIYRGDDVCPGKTVLSAGRKLNSADIGALASMGKTIINVCKRPIVGIISTGNELVSASKQPAMGQIRDVNSIMLSSLVESMGGLPKTYGIIMDEENLLGSALDRAISECDVILISGGSSVGAKDVSCQVIEQRGQILFHGIAMKPGKPTLLGQIADTPVMGLPGHPAAAFFVAKLFLPALLESFTGYRITEACVPAVLTETVSANHGRAQYVGVYLRRTDSRGDFESKSDSALNLNSNSGFDSGAVSEPRPTLTTKTTLNMHTPSDTRTAFDTQMTFDTKPAFDTKTTLDTHTPSDTRAAFATKMTADTQTGIATTIPKLEAIPIRSKSGLITALANSDGYFCIPRDCEGFSAGTVVQVTLHASY